MMLTQTNASIGPDQRSVASAELLDVRAVAVLLDCSARHVYRMSDGGRMPGSIHFGGLRKWRREELLSWITSGCPAVRSEKASAR